MERTTDRIKLLLRTSFEALDNSVLQDNVREPSLLYIGMKRLLDIVLSLLGIIVLAPVFMLIGIIIKLEDGGDVFYQREMVGLYGEHFLMWKFRTMVPQAELYLQQNAELLQKFQYSMKLQHDPRVTQVGRFLRRTYLDELPQLFNIFVGQMSLVGPRAIHESELVRYGVYAYRRHLVKPGLTGLWQISPNRHQCYEDRIPLDMYYIHTRTLSGDLTILFKTIGVFMHRTGV